MYTGENLGRDEIDLRNRERKERPGEMNAHCSPTLRTPPPTVSGMLITSVGGIKDAYATHRFGQRERLGDSVEG